jgi:hypothetical protein
MRTSDWLFLGAIGAGLAAIAPTIVEFWRRIKSPTAIAPDEWRIDLAKAEERLSAVSISRSSQEEPTQLVRILDLNEQIPVRIVVAKLPPSEDEPLRTSLTLEDLRAAESVIRAFPNPHANIVTTDTVDRQCTDNLVIIGSKRRNPVMTEVLDNEVVRQILEADFVDVTSINGRERWGLRVRDQTYVSPLFDQEREFKKDPTGYDGGFTDFGLLAKITNPWNPQAKILLVAGVRALGTAGTGQFLEENGGWLEERVSDNNFAVVVKVILDYPGKERYFAEAVGEPWLLSTSNMAP